MASNTSHNIATHPKPSIALHGVTMRYRVPKRYREYLLAPLRVKNFVALKDINLLINHGECVALLGANGSGKTTLLKLIGGLLYPSEGRVFIKGFASDEEHCRHLYKVGMVLNEDRSFYWRLTGRENLEFFGALEHLYGRYLRQRIKELLELVGLGHAGDRRVSDYSSGMRQRLAIARGLLIEPDVLILDEPTKSLDPLGADEVRLLIARYLSSNPAVTMLIATHCMDEAAELCDRVCIIRSGQIVSLEATNELKDRNITLERHYKSVLAGE